MKYVIVVVCCAVLIWWLMGLPGIIPDDTRGK